jgi:cell shape-determining protein MreC
VKNERIIFRVDSNLKAAFMVKVKAENKRYTDVLTELLEEYINSSSEPQEIEEIKLRLQKLEKEVEKTNGLKEEIEALKEFRDRILAATK